MKAISPCWNPAQSMSYIPYCLTIRAISPCLNLSLHLVRSGLEVKLFVYAILVVWVPVVTLVKHSYV
jgi:hypothetical protein